MLYGITETKGKNIMNDIFTDLPMYDADADETLSQARKDACKVPYQDMLPQHIDKIFSSTYAYDKKTGKAVAKKPRSVHELIWCMLQSQMAIAEKLMETEKRVADLEEKLKQKV